jgi:hypothetical protein
MIELIILSALVGWVICSRSIKKEKQFSERYEQDELWRKEYRK